MRDVPSVHAARRRRYVMRGIAGCLLLGTCLPGGCAESTTEHNAPRPDRLRQTDRSDDPIVLWRSGKHDDAIRALERWASRTNPQPLVIPMRERDFASLPQSERENTLAKVMERQKVLRALARELDRRARAAHAVGDHDAAKSLAHTLETLGTAHRGKHLLDITNMVGETIERLTDQLLRDLGD